jgi:hypothetical protein
MAQKAIIHTSTRVIRRLTTDASPAITSDETVVDLAVDIDLVNGPWKLDLSNVKVQATAQENQDAGQDEAYNATQRSQLVSDFRDASITARTRWQAVADNSGLPAAVRQAGAAQVTHIEALAKLLKAALT